MPFGAEPLTRPGERPRRCRPGRRSSRRRQPSPLGPRLGTSVRSAGPTPSHAAPIGRGRRGRTRRAGVRFLPTNHDVYSLPHVEHLLRPHWPAVGDDEHVGTRRFRADQRVVLLPASPTDARRGHGQVAGSVRRACCPRTGALGRAPVLVYVPVVGASGRNSGVGRSPSATCPARSTIRCRPAASDSRRSTSTAACIAGSISVASAGLSSSDATCSVPSSVPTCSRRTASLSYRPSAASPRKTSLRRVSADAAGHAAQPTTNTPEPRPTLRSQPDDWLTTGGTTS